MLRICLLLALALGFLSGSARAEDRYFLIVMGSQRTFKSPDHAHTFATFVKRCDGPNGVQLETRTISWLPASQHVRTLKIRPETGKNYGLDETIRFLQGDKQRVSLWGPYEIGPELFELAGRKVEELDGGRIRYKSYDGFYRSDNVTNCIHAVASVTGGHRVRVFGPGWGDTASYFVLESMMPWVVGRTTTHDCVVGELGLDKYAIAYRKVFDKPRIPPASGLPLVIHDGLPEPTYGPPAVRGRR